MMKKYFSSLIVLAMLFTPVVTYSAGPCGDYESADLQNIGEELFLKVYCDVLRTTRIYAQMSLYKREIKADFNSCDEVKKKMERIYMERFKIKDPDVLIKKCGSIPKE